jgi:serine/threonine protein kinase
VATVTSPSVSPAGPEYPLFGEEDVTISYPHVRCDAIAKGFGTTTQRRNYAWDLNDRNVMWDIAPLDNVNTETEYELLGRPMKIALSSDLWKSGELVKSLEVPMSSLRETVYLGDFGMVIKAGDEVEHKELWSVIYCAPELFHNANPSFVSDMWSLMIPFIQLYLGSAPFHSLSSGRAISTISNFATIHGMIRITSPLSETLGAMVIRARRDINPNEWAHILSIVSKGFSYRPENRLSATQLLQDTPLKPSWIFIVVKDIFVVSFFGSSYGPCGNPRSHNLHVTRCSYEI